MKYDPRKCGADCDHCPLQGDPVVPPEGPPDSPWVLVGEAPGPSEIKFGRPFIGPSGVKLDELIEAQGWRRKNVFITNALLCRPQVPATVMPGAQRFNTKNYMQWLAAENKVQKKLGRPPIKSPFDCCAPRLLRELEQHEIAALEAGHPNGASVQPMGNFAAMVILDWKSPTGIMKIRGSVYELKLASDSDEPP